MNTYSEHNASAPTNDFVVIRYLASFVALVIANLCWYYTPIFLNLILDYVVIQHLRHMYSVMNRIKPIVFTILIICIQYASELWPNKYVRLVKLSFTSHATYCLVLSLIETFGVDKQLGLSLSDLDRPMNILTEIEGFPFFGVLLPVFLMEGSWFLLIGQWLGIKLQPWYLVLFNRLMSCATAYIVTSTVRQLGKLPLLK